MCVSSLLIAEIKRIIKDSEIMKYGLAIHSHRRRVMLTGFKGRRLEMASEKQGRTTGIGNPTRH